MNGHLDELAQAGERLARHGDYKHVAAALVEQAADHSHSDLTALYTRQKSKWNLFHRRGKRGIPKILELSKEFESFIEECQKSIVLSQPCGGLFDQLFLLAEMTSGMLLPLRGKEGVEALLILNSQHQHHYQAKRFHFLDSLSRLAGGLLENALMAQEVKKQLQTVESLERYQGAIFSSMENLLVTTDEAGKIQYWNPRAQEALGLMEGDQGTSFAHRFQSSLDAKVIDGLSKLEKEAFITEGIFRRHEGEDMDYALTATPLRGKRGKKEGTTLVFADQSRERELRNQAQSAVEERRIIKDMFGRYLSSELVSTLTENPQQVRLGGDERHATVLFADITGYTAFSEGKDPGYVIEVLNAFFEQAVELVISTGGFIDKFIGDCIMAAWGVPLEKGGEDAVGAVKAALGIHELVRSQSRSFFQGDASALRISAGVASGPLVAGNVGSRRRMEYTVLGDTVNTAARLEGLAQAEDVLITRATRDLLGEGFLIEKREPVRVKGKAQPLEIFNVKGFA